MGPCAGVPRKRVSAAASALLLSARAAALDAEVGGEDSAYAIDGVDPHAHARQERREDAEASVFGYTPDEGFRLRSKDGAYRLQIALRAGLKFEPAWNEGDSEVRGSLVFVRPILHGNVYKPWIGYTVSMELADDDPFLLDAFVDVQPIDAFGIRVGQQGTPVSRHEGFGPHQIFFPEYAAVPGYFWSGRERGATLFGTVLDERLDYYAGAFSGSPLGAPTDLPHNYVLEGRLTANPMGPTNLTELPFTPDGERLPMRVSFTAQGYYGELQTTVENYNPSNSVLTPITPLVTNELGLVGGDLWFQAGRAIVFSEFYWRRSRPLGTSDWYNAYGAWGQAVVDLYRQKLGAGVRCNWLNPNAEISSAQVYEVEGQLAWFIHAPQLVLKLRYAWLKQRSPDADELDAFTLPFPVGITHVATLQLMLAF